jgi:CRP/FNR family cyclic AMP-dependent transcriptional regulator
LVTGAIAALRSLNWRDFLRSHPLLSALGADLVDRMSARAVVRKIKRGAAIFRKGDPGNSLFAVRSGSVKISAPSSEGKDAVLNVLGPGGVFGEIALLDGGPRTADAVALSDCELLVLERRDFLPLVKERPDALLKLIELVCGRLRHTSEQVEDIVFLDLPGRLAKTLLKLSQEAPGAGRKIQITQREIGQIIGMSRESTNKQLRAWESRKLLKIERGGIIILKPEALAALSGESASV